MNEDKTRVEHIIDHGHHIQMMLQEITEEQATQVRAVYGMVKGVYIKLTKSGNTWVYNRWI